MVLNAVSKAVVVAIAVSVAAAVLNEVSVEYNVVVVVLCVVLNVVVVVKAVSCTPDIVEVEVSVFLDVVSTTVKGPASAPPSFTYTSLILLRVPLSLTAK